MQLSNKERFIYVRLRIKELSSRILTQEAKLLNATESIATLKAEQEKLEKEFIQL